MTAEEKLEKLLGTCEELVSVMTQGRETIRLQGVQSQAFMAHVDQHRETWHNFKLVVKEIRGDG